MIRPDRIGDYRWLCGVCYTRCLTDLLRGKVWCVNNKCEQYREEFHQ